MWRDWLGGDGVGDGVMYSCASIGGKWIVESKWLTFTRL